MERGRAARRRSGGYRHLPNLQLPEQHSLLFEQRDDLGLHETLKQPLVLYRHVANLPEETGHYAARLSGGWSMLFYLNPILNWVVPLVVLLPAGTKRHAPTLAPVATLVLLGRWLDCYLLAAPAAGPLPGFPTAAVAASLAVLGGMALLLRRILAREAMDPMARHPVE